MLRGKFARFARGRMTLPARLLVGAAPAVLAVVMQAMLVPLTGELTPFALVYVAVLGATVVGGWKAGLTAIIVGQTLAAFVLLRPAWELAVAPESVGALVLATVSELVAVMILALYQHRQDEAAAERSRQLAVRDVLVAELNHRVKNTLAVVQGITHQTFREGGDPVQLHLFESRLAALSAAHDLLTRSDWTGAKIGDVVERSLEPFVTKGPRLHAAGPDLLVPPKAAVNLALAFHELATNAVKYGALSNASGRVSIIWENRSDTGFALEWREQGGPPVRAPTRRGFGSRLLERNVAVELGGSAQIAYAEDGLVCRISGRPLAPHAGRTAADAQGAVSRPSPPASPPATAGAHQPRTSPS